jgi:transcriptional/translational regulatory protein YebC/TACO1
VIPSEQGFELRCSVHAFDKVSQALEQRGIKPDSAEIAYIPTTTVPVADPALAATLEKLHDALEELDDVQNVFSNEDSDESASARDG